MINTSKHELEGFKIYHKDIKVNTINSCLSTETQHGALGDITLKHEF
jgi:hypothetical protein